MSYYNFVLVLFLKKKILTIICRLKIKFSNLYILNHKEKYYEYIFETYFFNYKVLVANE